MKKFDDDFVILMNEIAYEYTHRFKSFDETTNDGLGRQEEYIIGLRDSLSMFFDLYDNDDIPIEKCDTIDDMLKTFKK